MNYFKNLEDELYIVGWFAVIFAIAGAALYLYVIPLLGIDNVCTFYAVTGLYCPGCGGTRAVYSLLHGKIIKSLYFHPIVLYSLVMYGGFMVSHTDTSSPGYIVKPFNLLQPFSTFLHRADELVE